MVTLTGAVICNNEELDIAACLESLGWVDELLVLDSGSTDRTVEIARRYTSLVDYHPFASFPNQRNTALERAHGRWILFVDADEQVTPELAQEIRAVLEQDTYAGFWIPRRNIILGKWIKHAGWYPDHQLRLFRRDLGRYDETREVHELLDLAGEAGRLSNPFVHVNYRGIGEFLAKQGFYSTYEARTMHRRGVRARPRNFVLQPWREFYRRYIGLHGYRDGLHGLFLCTVLAWYNLVTYVKLTRLGR